VDWCYEGVIVFYGSSSDGNGNISWDFAAGWSYPHAPTAIPAHRHRPPAGRGGDGKTSPTIPAMLTAALDLRNSHRPDEEDEEKGRS